MVTAWTKLTCWLDWIRRSILDKTEYHLSNWRSR